MIRNFFLNKENRVILITGTIGIGKSSFFDWMFKKAFGDWESIKIHIPDDVRFSRIIGDISYKLGLNMDTDTLSYCTHKIFRQKVREIFKLFYRSPKRALIIDDLYHIFRQKNARDYRQLNIFFEEISAPKYYIGGRVFLISSSWLPDKWFRTAGVSHLPLKGVKNIYARRIIEYQMRHANLLKDEMVPEIPQALLDLVKGHPLSAKLVVEALSGEGLSTLSDDLTIANISGHIANELLKRVQVTPDEQKIMTSLSIFRLPIYLDILRLNGEYELNYVKILNLANRSILGYDGQSIYIHEAVRRFYYNQINKDNLINLHKLAAKYYQRIYDDERRSRVNINPSIIGELAHHLALSGEISKVEDLRLFVINEMKPAARKIYRVYQKYERALSLFAAISRIVPDDPEVWAYIGRCYGRIGQWNDSDQNFKNAIEVAKKIGERTWWIYRDWGHIRARYQFFEIAEDHIKKSKAENPSDPSIHAALAYMRWQQGEIEQACDYFEKALELNPYHEYSLTYYPKLLESTGEYEYAKIFRERSKTIDPNLVFKELVEYDLEIDDVEEGDLDDMA